MSVFNTVITEENGQQLKAYVAKPKSGKGPGLVLMHEVYGVTKGLTEIADKFAEAGFVVACPNMYWRQDSDASFAYEAKGEEDHSKLAPDRAALLKKDRDVARHYMLDCHVDHADGIKHVLDTIDRVSGFLRTHKNCNGLVGVSGFCFGARNTYLAMAAGKADAGAAFYPTPELHRVFSMKDAQGIAKPLAVFVGGEDPYINDDEKEDMIVAASGQTVTYVAGRKKPLIENNADGNPNMATFYYANSTHGFNRRDSKYSDPETSQHALTTAIEFLKSAMGMKTQEFKVPEHALKTTPSSVTYHPVHKV